jgi:nucleoside-diphosphate-sugar epimerase
MHLHDLPLLQVQRTTASVRLKHHTKEPPMRYFLTGATGFIGGRLARQLVAAGHEVVALVRTPSKAQDLAALGITLSPGDITDKESMRAGMAGADGLFHVAGWYKIGVRDGSPGDRINVAGTRNVLELMQELGIPKGVYTSTLAVNSDTKGQLVDEHYHFHGPHLSEYDRTKAAAHDLAEQMMAAGLPLVIVMPGVVYGPDDPSNTGATLTQYLQRKLPMIPQQSAYCWAHVDDIAQAHRLAMEKGKAGESYIIGGPPHTLVEALQIAQELTGIPAPRSAPPWLFTAMSRLMGIVERVVPVPDVYTAEGLRILAGATYIGNNAKARRDLGYQPRPLREGLAETLLYEMEKIGLAPASA